MYYLPTLEECQKMVAESDSFIEKVVDVHGFEVRMFNYFLAMPQDFNNPIKDCPEVKGHELRGLTFVKQSNGEYKRHLMLHKFFNVNQCEGYMEDELISLCITQEQDKRDGSMIRFITLPDGRIVAKSKMDFFNDQSKCAQNILDSNPNLLAFVKEAHELGFAPIFEYTSPTNRIVLRYDSPELVLIQMRDETTGEYLNISNHELVKKYTDKVGERQEAKGDLSHYLGLKKTLKDREGWILVLSCPHTDKIVKFAKVKTDWYMEQHVLLTDLFARENIIMELILDDKVDDLLAELDQDDPRRNVINSLVSVYNDYVRKEASFLTTWFFENFKGDRKEFALKFAKTEKEKFNLCSRAMTLGSKDEQIESMTNALIADIRKTTKRLEKARDFLENRLNFVLSEHFINQEEE